MKINEYTISNDFPLSPALQTIDEIINRLSGNQLVSIAISIYLYRLSFFNMTKIQPDV